MFGDVVQRDAEMYASGKRCEGRRCCESGPPGLTPEPDPHQMPLAKSPDKKISARSQKQGQYECVLTFSNFSMVRLSIPPHL